MGQSKEGASAGAPVQRFRFRVRSPDGQELVSEILTVPAEAAPPPRPHAPLEPLPPRLLKPGPGGGPSQPAAGYRVGVGKADVTDYALGLPMQGMSDLSQRVTGVESALWARAFVVESEADHARVALVVADIWTCTLAIKRAVVEQLSQLLPGAYDDAHVHIAGTHTHSGPGGFSHHFLYNISGGGFDEHNFETIVHGVVSAIRRAHDDLGPGRVLVGAGAVADCGRNRSLPAYLKNPQAERDRYRDAVEREMVLLKFVKAVDGQEAPVGMLCWYGVHPTDRGQGNTLVTGDNKGHAARLFEEDPGPGAAAGREFVAAFANATAGDVSGNVEFAQRPDGVHDREHMRLHGQLQFQAARKIFAAATEELAGPVAVRHRYVDMPARTGLAGALGFSMFAGSSEDSTAAPGPFVEGMVAKTFEVDNPGVFLADMAEIATFLNLPALANWASNFVTRGTLGTATLPTGIAATRAEHEGHFPKPIAALPGKAFPDPATPNVIPAQLIRIGQFALIGLPTEITTMAGRRLRGTVLDALAPAVSRVALGSYANAYCQYITTREEYSAQHYEGASTLFGPGTLEATQGVFDELALGLLHGTQVAGDPPPADFSTRVLRKPRITLRNLGDGLARIRVYRPDDASHAVPYQRFAMAGHGEQAFIIPLDQLPRARMEFFSGDQPIGPSFPATHRVVAAAGQLVSIRPDGSLVAGAYSPRTAPGPLVTGAEQRPPVAERLLQIRNPTQHDALVRIFDEADGLLLADLPGGELKVTAGGGGSWPVPDGRARVKVTFDGRSQRVVPVDQVVVVPEGAWITIHNGTGAQVIVRLYRPGDTALAVTLSNGVQVLTAHGSLTWPLPEELVAAIATFDGRDRQLVRAGDPLTYAPRPDPVYDVTINNSGVALVTVRFYQPNDTLKLATLPDGVRPLPGRGSITWRLPAGMAAVRATFDGGNDELIQASASITYTPRPEPRVLVRNRAARGVLVRFYDQGDGLMLVALPGGEKTVGPGEELAWSLPGGRSRVKVTFNGTHPSFASAGAELFYEANGSVSG